MMAGLLGEWESNDDGWTTYRRIRSSDDGWTTRRGEMFSEWLDLEIL